MVKINGKETDAAGKTIAEYLAEAGMDKGRVAVEVNGDIVPRAQHTEHVIADGDTIEIVRFVGGG